MQEKPFLSQVKGFTPVIDVLANELGTMTALVYGIAWRYCQLEDKVCRASKETIGKHANISPKTVQRHLHALVKAGYLEDTTPDQKHRPHVYKDTGKAQIIGLVEARIVGRSESPTSEVGSTESPTCIERQDIESHLGGTESPIKKEESKRETSEKIKKEKEGATAPPADYLDHVMQYKANQGNEGIAEPDNDDELWFQYRDRMLASYKKHTGLNPDANVGRSAILELAAATNADPELWDRVVYNWKLVGWNPRNIKGMIEFYNRGEIPSTGKRDDNGKSKKWFTDEEYEKYFYHE